MKYNDKKYIITTIGHHYKYIFTCGFSHGLFPSYKYHAQIILLFPLLYSINHFYLFNLFNNYLSYTLYLTSIQIYSFSYILDKYFTNYYGN